MNAWIAYYRDLIAGKPHGAWGGLQRAGLALASIPYGWMMGLRNFGYRRGWRRIHRVEIPVVSIGNLTLGGTGKTPCVDYVARHYRERGLRVALLSRGYGVVAGQNDEALLLAESLPDVPHLLGPDRVAQARTAIEELESEILVLDDAFQHRRLHRDLDLVLVDATNPWGHDWLFPRGLLREGKRGLKRASAVIITRSDQVEEAARQCLRDEIGLRAPRATLVEACHRPLEWVNSAGESLTLSGLRDKPVLAFSGIGNPESFRRTLKDLGTKVLDFREFPDHHDYARADIEGLRRWAGQASQEASIVTTQKDLVKIRLTKLGGRPLWSLRIGLEVLRNQPAFDALLDSVIPCS